MNILVAKDWKDYELIDSGGGERLERFGEYILIRPDPQCTWKKRLANLEWEKADATFKKESGEKGRWIFKKKLPEKWVIKYQNLSFNIKLSPFKHTGVFPEQAVHWEFISSVIASEAKQSMQDRQKIASSGRDFDLPRNDSTPPVGGAPLAPFSRNDGHINILNLFGYTGGASLAAAEAGAKVTHVDASYPTIGWARENQKLSGLEDRPIRWILDDAIKFCDREVKRGVKYDGIIMDPPIYGHGPKGEKWDFNESFPKLLEICDKMLNDRPLFVIVNAYAISSSALMLENVLDDYFKDLGGKVEVGELALQERSGRLLSTGIFARVTF